MAARNLPDATEHQIARIAREVDVSRSVKRGLKMALGVAIGVLIVLFARDLDWRLLANRIRATQPAWLSLAVALLFARLVSWSLRWSAILNRTSDETGAGRRLAILFASVMANHVVPSMRLAGGLTRARYLARGGRLQFGEAYATVLFDTTLHHTTSGVLTWVTMIGASWVLGYRWLATSVLLAGIAILAYVAARLKREDPFEGWLARYLRGLRKPGGRLSSVVDRGRGLARMLRHLAGQRNLRWTIPLYSLAWVTISVLAQWAIFRGMGLDVGFWIAAAAIGLGVIATVLTQTPGGIGSTEAAMVAAFAAFGVDQVDALAGTLLYRGIHYVLVLGIGVPAMVWCEASTDPKAAAEPAAD